MRIDEHDQNSSGERTWGVSTATGYIVVTEDLNDFSLRTLVLVGTASEADHEAAKNLVETRRKEEQARCAGTT